MKVIHILLVEDNEGDILLTKEALEERRIVNKVSVVKNGIDAIDFLLKQNSYVLEETPDLVLLDINLPKKNGHEVLEVIKSDERSKRIPVIMLTTSSSSRDINLAYSQHVNCFVTKPIDVDDFLKAILSIEDFWVNLVKLSTKS